VARSSRSRTAGITPSNRVVVDGRSRPWTRTTRGAVSSARDRWRPATSPRPTSCRRRRNRNPSCNSRPCVAFRARSLDSEIPAFTQVRRRYQMLTVTRPLDSQSGNPRSNPGSGASRKPAHTGFPLSPGDDERREKADLQTDCRRASAQPWFCPTRRKEKPRL